MEETIGLRSYNPGDNVYIQDQVFYMEYKADADKTVIMFNCQNETFKMFPIFIEGDQTIKYQIGETIKIPANLKSYTIENKEVVWLEGWFNYYAYGEVSEDTDFVNIEFVKKQNENTLIVASRDPGLLWSEFQIDGICDISSLSDTVEPGDQITDCSGTITIIHISTNTVVHQQTFN